MWDFINRCLFFNHIGDLIAVDFMFETTRILIGYQSRRFIRFRFTFGNNHFTRFSLHYIVTGAAG